MKIGPGRNSKSPSRWFQIDEPVTSEGMRSGRELDAREAHAQDLGERAGGERLREARVVLEEDVPIGEEPEQHELERLALADDGLLDLVEDVARKRLDTCKLHAYVPSSASTTSCELLRRDPAREPVLRCGPIGTDELPGRVADD